MVEGLAASYIALKLENEILQAQVQKLMEENAALQAQIPELQESRSPKDEPLQKPSKAQQPQKFPKLREPTAAWGSQEPSAIKEPQETPELKELALYPQIQEPWESPEIKESQELPRNKEPPRPPEIKEAWEPPEFLDPTAAWECQEPSKIKEAHKPAELQDFSAWKLPAAQELQEAQKPLELPAASEPQNRGQEASEYQASSLKLPATQDPLGPWVPQEPLDPSDTQEFLEPSVPEESLEGLIVVETATVAKFPQALSGLEAAAFPLEYPLAFNGDSQKLPEFLVQLNGFMRVRRHLHPNEAALVSFVVNCFSGDAGRWFQPLMGIQSPLLEQFESFLQVLQNASDNPENTEVSNHSIHQLCQDVGTVHRYAAFFHRIAQYLSWDKNTLCIQFPKGLASSLQNELSRTSPATNVCDMIPGCVSLKEKMGGEADDDPSEPNPSEERNGPENQPAQNQPAQATGNRPHLSEAERARRREGHLCLYCGHPGHFARDCPVKPHRAQQAGNLEARR
uniref:Retrotransposon Gag like 3 n=1 Tax=Jaculus jaculus TaxID=51337 RepID=A0A8C5KNN1_JACJA